MSLITFSAFRTAINTLVFPDGQAEVRVPLFRNFIVNALIQLQTFCESYQLVNVNFYDKDQSWDDCGLSIVQGCRGRIGAVYAFKPSCRCQRFFYDSASLEKLSCFYEHCRCHQSGTCCCGQSAFSAPSLYTANPYYCGDYVDGNTGCRPPYLQAEPEDDCAFRLSEKFFAVGPNQKIWLFPRFPCGYILGVHWRGIRRSYLDNDYVPDDDDLKDAVATYVESEVARRVDKDQATADKLYAAYRIKAGDIIFREEQDLKPRATRICIEGLDMSELVQIYPDNPYPVQVGESCATGGAAPAEPEPFSGTGDLFWWPFGEASGNRVDVVHSVPLVPANQTHMVQGDAKVGKGLSFVSTVNATVILQSAITTALAYAGGGFDSMFWLKVTTYGASTQILVPRFRFYDINDVEISGFTFNAFNASIAQVDCNNNGESVNLNSPIVPATGTWYCIRAFYDASDKKVGIQINNGTAVKSSTAFSTAMPVATKGQCGVWHLGSGGGSLDVFLVDELVVRIGSLFTAAEVTDFYAAGAGRTYP